MGALGLAKGIAGISLLRLNGIFRVLADVPPVSLSMILAFGAVAVGALFTAIPGTSAKQAARVALDSITWGLSMFDGRARLILCNNVTWKCLSFPEIFRNGTPLCDILSAGRRLALSLAIPINMSAMPSKRLAEGRPVAQTVELEDGRSY